MSGKISDIQLNNLLLRNEKIMSCRGEKARFSVRNFLVDGILSVMSFVGVGAAAYFFFDNIFVSVIAGVLSAGVVSGGAKLLENFVVGFSGKDREGDKVQEMDDLLKEQRKYLLEDVLKDQEKNEDLASEIVKEFENLGRKLCDKDTIRSIVESRLKPKEVEMGEAQQKVKAQAANVAGQAASKK